MLLLITENSGAMHRDLVQALHGLAAQSSLTTSEGSTQYGTARTSPSSFFAHHLANVLGGARGRPSSIPSLE